MVFNNVIFTQGRCFRENNECNPFILTWFIDFDNCLVVTGRGEAACHSVGRYNTLCYLFFLFLFIKMLKTATASLVCWIWEFFYNGIKPCSWRSPHINPVDYIYKIASTFYGQPEFDISNNVTPLWDSTSSDCLFFC